METVRSLSLAMLLCLLAACSISLRGADGADGATPARASDISWIEGCWETDSAATREVWTRTGPNTLSGESTTLRNGAVVFTETLDLTRTGGQWVYTAKPEGQSETRFTEAERGAQTMTFTNPAHDFPQVIRYARTGPDGLTATIDALVAGKARQWTYRRCQ